MGIDLYSTPASAPARMVLLLAKHLDVSMNVINLDLLKQEQLKPEFVAINPQHAVPTMVDNGFVITESRAILQYLQNKYGKEESLYPKDAQKRAVVDMRLLFDATTLYTRFGEAHYPTMFAKAPIDQEKMAKIDEVLGFTEIFLKDGYIAGSQLTIADFSVAATLSTMDACGVKLSKFPKVSAYYQKCKSTMKGWDEVNQPGADIFGQWWKGALEAL